ncbi:MAG: DNA-binding transcriptional regulator [Pseudomonadota bacterium]
MVSRILKELHETAKDMHEIGTLDTTTMREFDALCLPRVEKLTPKQIRTLRVANRVSQTVFAAYLNISASTVRQWENGDKSPSGPSLKLLNIVRKKGLQAIV